MNSILPYIAIMLLCVASSTAEPNPVSTPSSIEREDHHLNEVVLKIGSISVTKYILQREFAKARSAKQPTSEDTISSEAAQEWLDSLCDQLLIANEASENGYFSDKRLQRSLKIMSDHVLVSSPRGRFMQTIVLKGEYKNLSKREILKEKHKWRQKMISENAIEIKEPAFENMYSMLKELPVTTDVYDANLYPSSAEEILFESKQIGQISSKEFIDFLNTSLFRKDYTSKDVLRAHISDMLIHTLSLKTAYQNEFQNHWKYVQEKKISKSMAAAEFLLMDKNAETPLPQNPRPPFLQNKDYVKEHVTRHNLKNKYSTHIKVDLSELIRSRINLFGY